SGTESLAEGYEGKSELRAWSRLGGKRAYASGREILGGATWSDSVSCEKRVDIIASYLFRDLKHSEVARHRHRPLGGEPAKGLPVMEYSSSERVATIFAELLFIGSGNIFFERFSHDERLRDRGGLGPLGEGPISLLPLVHVYVRYREDLA